MYCQPNSLHFYKIAVAICTAEMLLSRDLHEGFRYEGLRWWTMHLQEEVANLPSISFVPKIKTLKELKRFTNEDHLAVHEHKHEMTLKFGPARGNSVTVADPKPTPTRFLKYCEEVGLFNELTSPMDFKIAPVGDIRKMPLDLSPLATPMIMHNKIEDHSAVAAHWDSPLCPIQNLQQGMTW
uniref:cyclic AMP-dependent transcription factor ATF-2-like n=1 Tax=Oncorhynchus gorbuscha TaxID=8017 RepID=UPI001EAEE39D|nr:cyclic AMP-dependent transcription factor ATF-2-like [Oncorhynchus gorbuscha]